LDTKIKSQADSLYENVRTESAANARTETREFLAKMAARQSQGLLSGPDIMGLVQIYARYTGRCIEARLNSYRKAIEEAEEIPTEKDLTQIWTEVEATQQQESRNATQALTNVVSPRAGSIRIDLHESVKVGASQEHGRALGEWKIWRSESEIRRDRLAKEEVQKEKTSAMQVPPTIQASPATAEPQSKREEWSREAKIAIWSFLVFGVLAVIAIVVALTTPEARRFVGLDKPNAESHGTADEGSPKVQPGNPTTPAITPEKPGVRIGHVSAKCSLPED
jgi:hypothetical protein